ncbi:MAG: DUF4203 domain-containing protein [Thermomicrobiales bacterium]
MDDFFLGLFALILGLGVCFLGFRLFFIMLPIWGFIAGFFIGAEGFAAIFGHGFLSTVTGWVLGFFIGLLFAVLSYLFWYLGAIIAAGSVGASLGSGLMAAFNVNTDWVIFIAAAIGAVLLAIIAIVLFLPVYIVIVSTAFLGATAVTSGIMLIFNQVDKESFHWGSTMAMINDSWFWLLLWAVVAAAGMVYQLMSISTVKLPDDRWARAQPAAAM